jgi:hypothetical protein
MKKITTLISALIMTLGVLTAQEEITTKDGRAVILNQGGTWEYVEKISEVETIPKDTTNCDYATEETDEFTGNKKLVMKQDVFLTHTSDEMKKYMKKKDYTTCTTYCAKIEGMYVLYVNWKILTKDAYKYYGSIEKGAGFTIKLKNGSTVELKYSSYKSGDANYSLNYTTYSTYIVLTDDDVATLSTNEVDKLRMSWSKGYQDYVITNSTFFINQLPCITK